MNSHYLSILFYFRREIEQIKNISVIRAFMMSFNIFLGTTAIYVCVLAYVLTGNILNAQYVFVLQSLYGVLKMSVTMEFPRGITQLAEANISVRRIKEFLLYDEVNIDSSDTFYKNKDLKLAENGVTKSEEPVRIDIKNASFKWIKVRSENTLENINMELGQGQLGVVIGSVGSGKSTLLHAILGKLLIFMYIKYTAFC